MFYEYSQNNSGGSFIMNDEVAHFVIIEADSADEANGKAEEVGIYFDDDYSMDCECCGTRWSRAWSNEGEEKPTIYGQDIADYRDMWSGDKAYAHVYYKDGTKMSFVNKPEDAE